MTDSDTINQKIDAQVDILNKCLDLPLTKELCADSYQKEHFCRSKYEKDHKERASEYVRFAYPDINYWGRINGTAMFYNDYHTTVEREKLSKCISQCHEVLNVDCDLGCDKNNCEKFCKENNYTFPL